MCIANGTEFLNVIECNRKKNYSTQTMCHFKRYEKYNMNVIAGNVLTDLIDRAIGLESIASGLINLVIGYPVDPWNGHSHRKRLEMFVNDEKNKTEFPMKQEILAGCMLHHLVRCILAHVTLLEQCEFSIKKHPTWLSSIRPQFVNSYVHSFYTILCQSEKALTGNISLH